MEAPKYQYHVLTWGGFYNERYKEIHGLEGGNYFFDTEEERTEFIKNRRKVADLLSANYLMISTSEGFCCDIETIIHRVIEVDGVQYYSQRSMGVNYPFSAAKYFLENRWYPGFNDYPVGEDYDYSDVKIVKEWVTGADIIEED